MRPSFVAGFGPIVRDVAASRGFWEANLGVGLAELAPGYWTSESIDGVQSFGLWPLAMAAQSCFGQAAWPSEIATPQAWIELDVESPDAVGEAVGELRAAGLRLLTERREEPWGQTTARLLSPEGLLVGVTYTPWLHAAAADEARA